MLATALLPLALAAVADVDPWIDKHLSELLATYKEFHLAPEISFHEENTAAKFAKALQAAGCEVTTGIGGHGVVAMLRNGDGPTVMLRTDLDALPLDEHTRLPYASKNKGVMHACGHDVHITNMIGVARCLAAHKNDWHGTVMIIGQPAEERVAGAKAMLDDGLFTKFKKPDFALALHVSSDMAAGKVGWRAGYAMANVDSVDITMKGSGGHGSAPHTTIDPIMQAAQLVVDLQTIVSREVKPLEPAVVTVGSIHGGTKHNIISDRCHLQLTMRSYAPAVRKQLKVAVERKARAVAKGARAPTPVVKFSEGCPSLYNDDKLVARVVPILERVLGKKNVTEVEPTMGAEDFAHFGLAGVPIFMYRLGSIAPKRLSKFTALGISPPSLHSPIYWPDPQATLRTGIRTMVAAVFELLKQP